jgi:hypothetical protein
LWQIKIYRVKITQGLNIMLNEIYKLAVDAMIERQNSSTAYCGWGSMLDDLVAEYVDNGGNYNLVRKVLNLAYYKY